MGGRRAVDFLAQAPDEHIDGAVAMRFAPAPQLLQQLIAGDDAAAAEGELVQKTELRWRQLGAAVVDVRLHLERVDPQLLDLDRLAARGLLAAHRTPRRRTH